jgi:lysophospholipase L1-like esterase
MTFLSIYRSALAICMTLGGLFATTNAQEQWHYTGLGDSLATGYTTTAGYVPTYQTYIQTDADTSVTLYNLGQNGATTGTLLNSLRTDAVFQNALLQSEVITWNIGINDFSNARNSYTKRKCGGNDNQDCLRNAVIKFKSNWDGIIDEILIRRGVTYTIIRTMDIYNPWVTTDKAKNTTPDKSETTVKGNDFQVLKYYLDQINGHIATTTANNLIPSAQVYLTFNGANGDEDPIAKGYIARDGLHPSDAGHQFIASLLRGLGYAPLF